MFNDYYARGRIRFCSNCGGRRLFKNGRCESCGNGKKKRKKFRWYAPVFRGKKTPPLKNKKKE